MCRSVPSASVRSPRPNPSIGPGPDRRAAKTERTDRTHGAYVAAAGRVGGGRLHYGRVEGVAAHHHERWMETTRNRQSTSSSASHALRSGLAWTCGIKLGLPKPTPK